MTTNVNNWLTESGRGRVGLPDQRLLCDQAQQEEGRRLLKPTLEVLDRKRWLSDRRKLRESANAQATTCHSHQYQKRRYQAKLQSDQEPCNPRRAARTTWRMCNESPSSAI